MFCFLLLLLLLLSRFSRVRLCATPWRQPTRLPRPWHSPGKNTGVGCHCLLQCMKVKSESEVAQSCPTLSDPMDCSLPVCSLRPWDFPGKRTGVGRHCLLLVDSKGMKKGFQWAMSKPTVSSPHWHKAVFWHEFKLKGSLKLQITFLQ